MPTLQVAIDASQSKDGATQFRVASTSIIGDAGKVDKALGGTTKQASSLSSAFKYFAGAAVLGGLYTFTRSSINEFNNQEKALAKLRGALIATGGVSGQTMDSLTKFADQLQKTTIYGDDLTESAQTILLTFTNVRGQAFERTMKAAADFSTVMDTDLKSSVLQLGKAINDPTRNLMLLSRAGVQVSDEQMVLVKTLQRTNRMAEAQALVLSMLEGKFRGMAETVGKTLAGKFAMLANAWGDFKEEFAGTFLQDVVGAGVSGLTGVLQKLTKMLIENQVPIRIFMVEVIGFLEKVGMLSWFVLSNLGKIVSYIYDKVKPALGMIGSVIVSLLGGLQEVIENLPGFDELKKNWNDIDKWTDQMIDAIKNKSDKIQVNGEQVAEGWVSRFKRGFRQMSDQVDRLTISADGISQAFGKAFEDAIFSANSFSDILKALLTDIEKAIVQAMVIQPLVQGIRGGILSAGGGSAAPATAGARGMIVQTGSVVPFATGGVVTSPTRFPLAGSRVGLMGESGAEAILPLGRTNDGKLGVKSNTGNVVIHMNIITKDADSFRQSRTQIMNSMKGVIRGV